jgi:hypothetical protein
MVMTEERLMIGMVELGRREERRLVYGLPPLDKQSWEAWESGCTLSALWWFRVKM